MSGSSNEVRYASITLRSAQDNLGFDVQQTLTAPIKSLPCKYFSAHAGEPRLVAFLGSTIGNFTEDEIARFFTMLREELRPEDRLLLGVDLLKAPAVLEAAYDDSQGITAQLNLNILARLNRELSAEFDLAAFRHRAVFNPERSRIEMHLVSVRDQRVRIGDLGLDIDFRQGG